MTCPTVPPVVQSEDKEGGPTPLGEYLIGKRRTNPTYNIDWYNLYPKKENNCGYYGYRKPNKKGRDKMGIHPGKVSQGCVTVKAPNYDKDACWKKIRKVIDSGNMVYTGENGFTSTYSGFLYVVK